MESERKQSVAVGRRLAVVAVDDSETSLKLANYAANELPAEYEVQLLHVQPSYYEDAHVYNDPTEVPGDPQLSAPKTPVEIAASFVTTRLLPIVKARHTDAEVVLVHIKAFGTHGNLGKAICQYAEQHRASLLIIGTSSKVSLTQVFMGSAVKYCTQHCTRPLLLVPTSYKP